MRSYLSLVPISARVHKRQSRMTRICIVLAVFLVTSLFSMADMWIRAETASMIRRHGNYHIKIENMTEDGAKLMSGRSDVAAASWYDVINPDGDMDYYISGKKTVLYGTEQTYMTKIRAFPTEGSYPGDDSEAMLSADAKELFGVHTGDPVTVSTPAGDFNYTISGFCEDDTQFNKIINGSCIYINMSALNKISSVNNIEKNPVYYIQFKENEDLRKAVADVKEQYGPENVDENTAVLGLSGASSNETAKNVYPLAAAAFLLILVSGVMMISSCINSNVAQRKKFFGMLRCIGASRQQIIRFVRLEALSWCKTAIPQGCFLGLAVNWILCAILRLLVKGEFADMPLFGVSAVGIVLGIAVGVITVFIAAHSPARQAARVSPVSAVSGSQEAAKTGGRMAALRFFRVETALGVRHAAAAKKNLVLMTGSFALSIILFFVFSACLDLVRSLLPAANGFSPDVGIVSQDNANSMDRALVREIAEVPGVEYAFGTMMAPDTPVTVNGSEGNVDLASYEEYMMNFSEDQVISGDLSKVYGDSGYALTVFSQDSRLDVGDIISVGGQEAEIACVLSFGIGGVTGGIPVVVCSEETFTRLTGAQGYTMINAGFTKDAAEAAVNKIQELAGENLFTDRREDDKENLNSYWVFRIAAYGFLVIISLITVLNIMNSISMSVSARIRQYGAMRAVGMDSRQVTKMVAAEAVTYAVFGCIAGHVFGLLLHYLIYKKLIITHFGGSWKVPGGSVLIILLIVFASCIAAVHAPARRIRGMAVTDTINEL